MFEEIKKLLVECASVDECIVTKDARLKEDLGIDSLYAVEMILQLETAYEIQIEWEEIQDLKTVNDVVNLVDKKLKEKK